MRLHGGHFQSKLFHKHIFRLKHNKSSTDWRLINQNKFFSNKIYFKIGSGALFSLMLDLGLLKII